MTEHAHRRFRFSLRTLLIVVTVVALACGWLLDTYRFVQSRRELWPSLDDGEYSLFAAQLIPAADPATISWPRRLMGDFACDTLIYAPARDPDGSQLRRARRLFPEARILGWPGDASLPAGIEPAWQAIGDHPRAGLSVSH